MLKHRQAHFKSSIKTTSYVDQRCFQFADAVDLLRCNNTFYTLGDSHIDRSLAISLVVKRLYVHAVQVRSKCGPWKQVSIPYTLAELAFFQDW